jgi:hypothetical protein
VTESSGTGERASAHSAKLEVGAKFEASSGTPAPNGSETVPETQVSRPTGAPAEGATDNKIGARPDLMGRVGEKDFAKKDNVAFSASAGLEIANEVRITGDPASGAETPKDAREQADKSVSDAKTINNFYIGTNHGDIAALLQQATTASAPPGGKQPGDAGEARAKLWSFAQFVLSQDRISDLSYALALAALSGAPVSAVNRAAEDLGERLLPPAPASDSGEAKPAAIQVVTPRRIVLAELGCEFFSSPASSVEVELSTERVRFRDPGADQLLLRDAWLNLRLSVAWMGTFLRWLSDQGRSDDLELRLAAGRTAGFLATWDSSSAESILFHSWIAGRATDALGAALLAFAGTSKAAEANVEKRLVEWTEGEGGKTRIITASILASGAFGHASPDMAFRILASLVRQKRYLTLDLAAMGYAVWFASAASDLSIGSRVIMEVSKLRSVHDDKIIRKLTGYYFLLLTAALDSNDGDHDDCSEKLFLQVIGASGDALRTAAGLFNELLAPNIHAQAALERFRSICMYAFRANASAQSTFLRLAESMYAQGDDEARDTLRYWLAYWLEEVQEHSAAAGLALDTLIENFSNGALAT